MTMLWRFSILFATVSATSVGRNIKVAEGDVPALQSTFDILTDAYATYFNVSLSIAAGFNNLPGTKTNQLTIVASASGYDRSATTKSQFPSGSVCKAFTSVAALRLAEKGLLDLDAPIYKILDPWNQKQGVATLLELWNGDAAINTVTSRELLSMRSGIPDYDDEKLFDWTIKNPTLDYLPQHFVNNVSKSFTFQPDQGGIYSGVGYVVMGMVLAAVSGAETWDQLDQMKLTGVKLNHTTFMEKGECDKYPDVVHQYTYGKAPYRLKLKPAVTATGFGTCQPGSPGYYPYCGLEGKIMASEHVSTASECCTYANRFPMAAGWQYNNQLFKAGGNCSVLETITGSGRGEGTCGIADHKLDPNNYTDLYHYSCLNGWTMGNIATSPSDVMRLYHSIATTQIINSTTLSQMLTFKPLTAGQSPPAGTPYGLGVLQSEFSTTPINSTTCDCTHCVSFNGRCYVNASGFGHPGLDWASGMPDLGWYPNLDAGYALAFNSYNGMNATMGTLENKANDYRALNCYTRSAIAQFKGTPPLNCQP